MSVRRPRYSGLTPPHDPCHYEAKSAKGLPGRILAPGFVKLKGGGYVAQWAPTARSKVTGFNPAGDCKGNFMSYRYQPNNNCYNYACNIATNSFAHPGRKHGVPLFGTNRRLTADSVITAAKADGLVELGRKGMKLPYVLRLLRKKQERGGLPDGHLVALLISLADSKIRWKGDFHWVRCDEPSGRTWSQKDGPDQVTNFDFSGNVIRDPSRSNWTVNQGPRRHRRASSKADEAFQTFYNFEAWMFVPFGKVTII